MDDQPLSDSDVGDRLSAARAVLGAARGATTAGDTAIQAAREGLAKLALSLIAAGEERDRSTDPPGPSGGDSVPRQKDT